MRAPGLHLYVGWLQKEAGVLLQDTQQRQGQHAAEADCQELRFLLQVQGWPQVTVWGTEGSEGGAWAPGMGRDHLPEQTGADES